ncbi:hypothetical protein [Pseudomonas lijiangensis]|uniref:Lipoprotein n=1 Tax=Pseudomonas lijiangensis TaxID=2995658 RepID=A0ABX8HVT2_9PSED|nr:hypothetical protein [Pseudomonas lijiangensis]MBX8500538.1 hypothetical protein [Pseudomonas lijiangensis]MBX8505004.1 hypothetical protein [Pseudomonas lijiangensis]QWU84647.1 hypothetical protein KQP88_07780 [Pseudomonas lijiangensis]
MKTYQNFIFLAALLCTACAKTPNIPRAELRLLSFETGPHSRYTVSFTSSIDLMRSFNNYENSNQQDPVLMCSLDHDTNFSADHVIKIKARGSVKAKDQSRLNRDFISEVSFSYSNPNGSESSLDEYDEIRTLIEDQVSIPCKVRIAPSWGYKNYYTNTFFIPSALILEKVRENNSITESPLPTAHPFIADRWPPTLIFPAMGIPLPAPIAIIDDTFFSAPFSAKFKLINETTGDPMANHAYAIQRADGSIEQGVSDAQGFTHRVRSHVAESVKVFVED